MDFSAAPLRSLRLCGLNVSAHKFTAETQRTQRRRREITVELLIDTHRQTKVRRT
jgi:hypothetical protein